MGGDPLGTPCAVDKHLTRIHSRRLWPERFALERRAMPNPLIAPAADGLIAVSVGRRKLPDRTGGMPVPRAYGTGGRWRL